jgi:hypothetical protein
MPLRDHFHPPWRKRYHWEGFNSSWTNTLVRHLNSSILPERFRAEPQIHLGALVESDVTTWDEKPDTSLSPEGPNGPAGGSATAVWSPPRPAETLTIAFADPDIYEVRVLDEESGSRLVAVIELVSPGNKDRPETRRAFVSKCAAYLQQQVGVLVVDVVTDRRSNLHRELLDLLLVAQAGGESANLYAVSYRVYHQDNSWRLDLWPETLKIGDTLPILPLWLADVLAVPIDLEKTYEETCQVLRIR